jgi:pyrrolidone-carboxylate peptidase
VSGFYVIATDTMDASAEVHICFDNGCGDFKGVTYRKLPTDYSKAGMALLNRIQADHPNLKFEITEDGGLLGLIIDRDGKFRVSN